MHWHRLADHAGGGQSHGEAFSVFGADGLMRWPCSPALDQVDRLPEIVS